MTITEKLKQAKGLLTVKQVAETISVHPMTIYKWSKQVEAVIPHHRVGSRLKFDGHAVAEWLEKRAVG